MGVARLFPNAGAEVRITQAGLALPYQPEEDKSKLNPELDRIFKMLGVEPNEWSTQIFDDASEFRYPRYEHQSGQGFLTVDVAMVLLSELAQQGNRPFADGLAKLQTYPATSPSYEGQPEYINYLQRLFQLLPDPDYLGHYNPGDSYRVNTDLFCPDLSRGLVDTYVGDNG